MTSLALSLWRRHLLSFHFFPVTIIETILLLYSSSSTAPLSSPSTPLASPSLCPHLIQHPRVSLHLRLSFSLKRQHLLHTDASVDSTSLYPPSIHRLQPQNAPASPPQLHTVDSLTRKLVPPSEIQRISSAPEHDHWLN